MTINAKYDITKYKKYGRQVINTSDYQFFKKDGLIFKFSSSYLAIFWHQLIAQNVNDEIIFTGFIKIRENTPLGAKRPTVRALDLANSQKTSFIQFLSINNEFPYTVEILNPAEVSKSSIEIWEYRFTSNSQSNPNNVQIINNMPYFPEPQSENMAALIAATQANANAIADLADSVTQSDASELVDVADPVIYGIGATLQLISSANDDNRGVIVNNQGNTKVKLFATDNTLPTTTSYASGGHFLDMTGKGVYEIPDKFVTTNIYAVGHAANGSVSVTISRKQQDVAQF